MMERTASGLGFLKVAQRRVGDELRLVCRGEFDVSGEETFIGAVSAVAGPADPLVIDLGDLLFVDSTALRVILQQHHRLVEKGVDVRIRIGDGAARRLFTMTGLADRMDAEASPFKEYSEDRGRPSLWCAHPAGPPDPQPEPHPGPPRGADVGVADRLRLTGRRP